MKAKVNGLANSLQLPGAKIGHLEIVIEGDDNQIHCGPQCRFGEVDIRIFGSRNQIVLGEKVGFHKGEIWIFGNDCLIEVGSRTTLADVCLAVPECGTSLRIGERCMLSTHIEVRTGDSHAIFDQASQLRLNHGRDIRIGDRVWVGTRVLILKGSVLAPGSVVAAGALVTREFEDENVIVGGQPARVLKTGVVWSRDLKDRL